MIIVQENSKTISVDKLVGHTFKDAGFKVKCGIRISLFPNSGKISVIDEDGGIVIMAGEFRIFIPSKAIKTVESVGNPKKPNFKIVTDDGEIFLNK
jgi:hypothetical protein